MAVDLLQLATDVLGNKQNLALLSKFLGIDENQAKSAVSLSAPAVLGSLISKSTTPSGAGQLRRALDGVDDGLLGSLAGMLTGGGADLGRLVELGGKLLEELLGSQQKDALLATLARLAGLNSKSIMSLLSVVLPLILSVIKRQVKSQALDASGLAHLMSDQAKYVQEKLPRELSSVVGLPQTASRGAAAQRAAAPDVASPKPTNLLWPILLVAVLAAIYFLWRPGGDAGKKGTAPGNGTAEGTADGMDDEVDTSLPTIDSTNTTARLSSALTALTTALSEVNDETSAREFVEKLGPVRTAIDDLALGQASASVRSSVSQVLVPWLAKTREALEGLYDIPGVRAIIEPAIQPLLDQLAAVEA